MLAYLPNSFDYQRFSVDQEIYGNGKKGALECKGRPVSMLGCLFYDDKSIRDQKVSSGQINNVQEWAPQVPLQNSPVPGAAPHGHLAAVDQTAASPSSPAS